MIIDLEGTTTNRSAIGTRVEVQLNSGKKLFRTVSTGGSFGSHSLQQHIGLGKADKINKLIISWQNGEKEVFESIEVNQKIAIKEGVSKSVQIPYTYIPFNKESGDNHCH